MPSRRSAHSTALGRIASAATWLALVGVAWGGVASGATPDEPPDARLSAAGSEAAALYARGELAAAIAELEAAAPEARTVVDRSLLGALYFEAGRMADAWSVLEPLTQPEDADAAVLYHAGRTALALGKRRIAVGLLERSVRQVPQSPAARELGLAAGQMEKYAEAFALLRPWALRHPDDLVAVRAAAAAALQLDRLRDAELLVRALPESDPASELLVAQLALRSGRPQEAVDRLTGLLDDPPPEIATDLRRLLADAHIQVGSSAAAIPLVESCARDEPRCALLLAEAQYRSGDIPAALAALQAHAAVALKDPAALPSDVRARLAQMHGRLLVAAARYGDALPYLQLSGELLPDEPLSWKSLGDALAALGERDQAMRAMERFRATSAAADERRKQLDAARQDPIPAALQEAQALLAAGRGEAALAALRREVVLTPDDVRARLGEIQILLRLERLDDALAAAEAAVAEFPTDADARYTRGIVYMARRELAASEADFTATLEITPGHVPALNDFAVLLMASGRNEEARVLLERALAIRPDDALAARHLESLTAETPP
jgi:tetratricopeptide (TPR) repeat protein